MTELTCYIEACRRSRKPGHRFCADHEGAVIVRRQPEWIRRMLEGKLPAKELSGLPL